MTGNKITSAQLTVWIITALIGPIVFFSKGNWLYTFVAAGIFALLNWVVVRYGRHWEGPIYAFIQVLWISVLLSQIVAYSAQCWPTGQQTYPIIPITMLVLAALSASKGDKSAANGMSVLFWVAAALIGSVIFFGIGNIQIRNLIPKAQMPNTELLLVFILPAVAGFLNKEKCSAFPFFAVAALAGAISLWIVGTLSPEIAEQLTWPFYDGAKSVQLLDIAKRFEALVSVGVTVGNYALYSMLFCAVDTISKPLGFKKGMIVTVCLVAVALMLSGFSVNPAVSLIISGILWLVFPLFGLIKVKEKE